MAGAREGAKWVNGVKGTNLQLCHEDVMYSMVSTANNAVLHI